jgi:hypothetical protein
MALADDNPRLRQDDDRDMVRGDATRYECWTMDGAKGARPVSSIPFPRNQS